MPGQTALPGSGIYPDGGTTGSISTQTAGAVFISTVNLVDKFHNVTPGISPKFYVNTSDRYDVEPSTANLSGGSGGTLSQSFALVSKTQGASLVARVCNDGYGVTCPIDASATNVCTGNIPITGTSLCRSEYPAGVTPTFKVYAAAAERLQVLLPGETAEPGKCDYQPNVICAPISGVAGKSGYPNPFAITVPGTAYSATVNLVDRFWNVTSERTGVNQDSNPVAVMPNVTVRTPSDPGAVVAPAGSTPLNFGTWDFNIQPFVAIDSYTVAATTDTQPAISSGTSARIWITPGPANHLHLYNVGGAQAAGSPFAASVLAHDLYHNLLSTGVNAYRGTVQIQQTNPLPTGGNQDPSFSPVSIVFSSVTDQGVKDPVAANAVTLRKSGNITIQAIGTANPPGIVSNLVVVAVSAGPADSVKVTPLTATNVGAGSIVPDAPGAIDITGQVTDAFDNPITAGPDIQISTTMTSGTTGFFKINWGGGWATAPNVGGSTVVVPNASGQLGVMPQIRYYVSNKAGDSARVWMGTMSAPGDVTNYINAQKDISGPIITVGGLPTKLVFLSTPSAATVGINEVSGAGGQYVIERRDDFDNVTRQGDTTVNLSVVETSIHAAAGFTLGTFGPVGDYGFRDNTNTNFINSLTIFEGLTGAESPVRYHDRMTSYSGVSPAANTSEKGRPGFWTIQAKIGATPLATHQLRMNPDVPTKLNFGNTQNTQVAGKVTNFSAQLGVYRAQLQDQFSNPVIATQTLTVNLTTAGISGYTRSPSLYNDYVAFCASSDTLPGSRVTSPSFVSPSTSSVNIAFNTYQTTFFYMDTTATVVYGSDKPKIRLTSPGLVDASTSVVILADAIDRIAVSSGAGQVLQAGTTSQSFALETRDFYGNPSVLRSGQDLPPGSGIVAFELKSNSPSSILQFSTPTTGAFLASPTTAYIAVGQSATSFYVIDSILSAPTWQLTVTGISYPGWEVAIGSYIVTAGPPAQIGWATPARRLIAGTTIEYQAGVPTQTVIAAELKDQFGNPATSASPYTIRYTSSKGTTWVGVDPTAVIFATSPSAFWNNIGPSTPFDKLIPGGSGLSQAPIYMWDTSAGTTTLTAQARFGAGDIWSPVQQDNAITPGPAYYMTIHHPFTASNPLKVGVANTSTITIRARDLFGNIATGDAQNGNSYSGVVNFGSSGSTSTVSMRDPIANATYHIFIPAEKGEWSGFQLLDTVQETLQLKVTDYYNPGLFGFTNDSSRTGIPTGAAFRSDADVVLAGVVVLPTDFAPESTPPPLGPIPTTKVSLGVTKKTLNQGDGTTTGSPDPIVMMRLTMSVAPSGGPALTAKLSTLKVKSRIEGNFDNNKITELALYKDANGNARFDAAADVYLGSGTYSSPDSSWFFGTGVSTPIHLANPGAAVLSQTPAFYFLTVRISSVGYALGELPASFGLELTAPSFVGISSDSQVGVAMNNFSIRTTTSSVEREPAIINVLGEDIASWWQPPSLALSSYSYVNQGEPFVGMMKLRMWTDAFTAAISRIRVTHSGTGLDSHIKAVRLFLDTQPDQITTPGDGIFSRSIDKEITDTVNPAVYPPGETRSVSLTVLNPSGMNGTITSSTKTYFVVFDYDPAAEPGQKHGVTITQSDITPLLGNGTVGSFSPLVSTQVVVQATPDQVQVVNVNTQGISSMAVPTDSIPSKISQNDVNQPVIKLTMRTTSGSAEWTGLKLDRWIPSTINGGGGSYNSLFAMPNKASDVKNIKIWRDMDEDGLLNVSSDTQVSPLAAIIHNFPTSLLVSTLTASGPFSVSPTSITVANIVNYYPSDNPFVGDQKQRLVIGDDQTDEQLKEVVVCDGVIMASNTFTGCLRAQENTVKLDWSTGAVISGPARIPIVGLFGAGGQLLDPDDINYFVTYDIDPVATVAPAANLGLVIPSTSYIQIKAPKSMATVNVGIPAVTAGGKTVSYVPNVSEVKDLIKVVSSNTIDTALGSFVQQNTTVAVAMFTLQTDIADALWRWILVFATGTATSAGSVTSDVDIIGAWYDANGDSLFNPAQDVLIGSGTFGNFGGVPLTGQILIAGGGRKILTPNAVTQPQRFFITYHITPNAQPVDSITGQPRTLGAQLKLESLPIQSPVVDNPLQNSLSLPNAIDPTSPLPWVSKFRAIIASPQTLFVKSTPYFSTSSGTFAAPTIDPFTPVGGGTAGTTEYWLLTSTVGLPVPVPGTTAYALVDGEIVSYGGIPFHPTLPQINVKRGQLNTIPSAHPGGTTFSPMALQGDKNLAALRLDLWTSNFQVQWSGLKLSRSLPGGLNGQDGDVSNISIYQSATPDGVFHRDPETGVNAGDFLMGTNRFGLPPDTDGRATVPVNDPTLGSPGYALLTASTKTFYVAMDIAPSAKFSHVDLFPQNMVTGVSIDDPTRVVLTPENAGHVANLLTLGKSPTFVLMPTVNKLNVTFDQVSGLNATQNDKNVPMVRFRVSTDRNSAILEKVKIDHLMANNALDTDITLVKIWKDGNGNGVFDVGDTTTALNGVQPHLLSFGNETFSSATVTIVLKTPILVSTKAADYFVTFDVSEFAAENSQFGARIGDPSYFTVQVPNQVVFSSPSFVTNPLTIVRKVISNVTLGVNNITGNVPRVNQAQQNVPFMRLNLATDVALAPWRSLRVERAGGSQDTSKPLGRNTDVKFVRVWKDIDQNDQLTPDDLNISEANTTLAVSITSQTAPFLHLADGTTYFDLVVQSTVGFPVDNVGAMIGGKIWVKGAELMTFSGPGCKQTFGVDVASGTGKPCLAIIARGEALGQGPTPKLDLSTAGATVSVKKVDVFDQTNDANVQSQITLANDQLIGPTPSSFFVAYDIGDAAVQNDLVGVIVRDKSWIGMPRGDIVAPVMRTNITKQEPFGTGSSTYPYVGSNVAINPVTLSVGGFTIAPSAAGQGQVNVPFLQMEFKTNQDFLNIAQIKFSQLGTVQSTAPVGIGDGDLQRIAVWQDNGDRVFIPLTDTILGSTVGFTGGSAVVNLLQNGIPYMHVTTATTRVFVVADLGFFDRRPPATSSSTLGHLVGIKLAKFQDLVAPNDIPLAAAPDLGATPPIESRLASVAPLTVPSLAISSSLPPVIMTSALPGMPLAAVGYPAYAKIIPPSSTSLGCNNGKDPNNPRNNICRDNGIPVADTSTWRCPNGLAWPGGCSLSDPPLVDINGDGIADNFSKGNSTGTTKVSIAGDGSPTSDLTNTGILDLDLNSDGITDLAFNNGFGGVQVLLGTDEADQGNSAKTVPVPDQGFVPSAWTDRSGQLAAVLPVIPVSGYYEVSVGRYFDDAIPFYTLKWSSVTMPSVSGLSSLDFSAQAAGRALTAARVTGLNIPAGNVTKLVDRLTPDTTSFQVADASKLTLPGLIYVGSEVMRVVRGSGNTLIVRGLEDDPPPGTGRGLKGSAPIIHLPNEPVSDTAAIFFTRYVSGASTSVPRAMFIYRVQPDSPDLTLTVSGSNLAPTGVSQNKRHVPLLKLDMRTSADSVNVSQIRFSQTGTIQSSTFSGLGDGDFSRLAVWLDNGDGVVSPNVDTLLGYSLRMSTADATVASMQATLGTLGLSTANLQAWTTAFSYFADVLRQQPTPPNDFFFSWDPTIDYLRCETLYLQNWVSYIQSGGASTLLLPSCYGEPWTTFPYVLPMSTGALKAIHASIPLSSGSLAGGTPVLNVKDGTVPYLRVSTKTVSLIITGDIGRYDRSGADTSNHLVGLTLNSLNDILGPNGSPLAAPVSGNAPFASAQIRINPVVVSAPVIKASTSATSQTVTIGWPIIIVRVSSGVTTGVGYPAFAKLDEVNCNNGDDPKLLRNNICRVDDRGRLIPPGVKGGTPIPDKDRWICAGKSTVTWEQGCPDEAPLVDLNGDGIPDNFAMGASTRPDQVSLTFDGVPTRDITGTGILDVDFNNDGIPDLMKAHPDYPTDPDWSYWALGTDKNDLSKNLPVPHEPEGMARFVSSAWTGKIGSLSATLPSPRQTAGYWEWAVGKFYDDPTSFSLKWSSVSASVTPARLTAAEVAKSTQPAAMFTYPGLTVPVPNVTFLNAPMESDGSDNIEVKDASVLNLPGLVYIGNEIVKVRRGSGNILIVEGRGERGSMKTAHFSGEPVSDAAAILFKRFVSTGVINVSSGVVIGPATPAFVFRADPNPPGVTGSVRVIGAQSLRGRDEGKTVYTLQWSAPANPPASGVAMYELQERGGKPTDLQSSVVWRTLSIFTPKDPKNPSYTVGDGVNFPGEAARPTGLFFSYRVRAISGAGVAGVFSQVATSVSTGLTESILAGVSNYPNPFDTRQGGLSGKTTILYTLGADSDVTIVIYDMLGYIVKSMNFSGGTAGGRAGPNFVDWDGRNSSGNLVSKGGYIARIKVKAPSGTATETRKIGVVH